MSRGRAPQLRRDVFRCWGWRPSRDIVLFCCRNEATDRALPGQPDAGDAYVDHDAFAIFRSTRKSTLIGSCPLLFPDGSTSTVLTTSSPGLISVEPVTLKY